MSAYATSRWIAGCERCRSYLVRQCEAAGFTPRISFTTDDYLAVQALVAAGLGVTTLPELCLRAARHPGIATTPLPGARRHVFAMTYGEPPDSKSTVRLIDMLARVAAQPETAGRARLDLGALVRPVRIAQAALEQLAAGVAGQLVGEVDRLRPLHLREPALQPGQDLGRQLIAG